MPDEITTDFLPPPGDEMIGFRVYQYLADILQDKSDLGLPARWLRNYQLAKNKHWLSASSKATLLSANLLFAHRTRTVNLLCDNNPTFQLSQQGDPDTTDRKIYDDLLHAAEHWWQEAEQQSVFEKSVTNGETNGCAIEKVVFNPDLEFGIGEVETEIIDPYHFGFWPLKCQDIQKADALFHFQPMPVREARRRWPEFAEAIKADDEILKDLGDDRREVQGGRASRPQGYFSTFAGIVKNMLNVSGDTSSDKQETLIVEVWFRDYTLTPEGTPLYPGFIRCVEVCSGGHVVLSDRPNPSINPDLPLEQAVKTYLWDKYPFSFTQSVTDPVNIWGMNDFEQLEGLQIEIDKSISQITLWKDRASRLKIVNPKDSGVHNDEFTNAPGIINPSSAMVAQGIRYMDPPKPPADLTNTLALYKDFFMLVAGTFDLDQAKEEGRSVIAYKAIAALIERAHTMLRGKIRNYTKMIRNRGRMYLSHVMNWYTEERWISYEDDGEEAVATIKGPDLIVPAKLVVVSGSTMPVSKIQIREEALELFDKGAIDNEELLKRLEWPDRKNVIKRMMQGPLGRFLERLGIIGVPEEMLQVFSQLANMDPKEFEKELKLQRIPPFQTLLAMAEGEQGNAQDPLQDAQVQETQAKIQKVHADIALIQEKINSERVEQQVKLAGIGFDEEQIKLKRAELVAEVEQQRHSQQMEKANYVSGLADQEVKQKMTQDSEKKKFDIEKKKVDVAEKMATQKAQAKGTAPYRERGGKSNNQKPGGQKK